MVSEFAWDQRYRVGFAPTTCSRLHYSCIRKLWASNIDSTLNLLGRRTRIAGACTSRTAKLGLHASHADRAWHPQFQMRDYSGTSRGLPQRSARRPLRASRRGSQCAARARNRRAVPASAHFRFWRKTNSRSGSGAAAGSAFFLDMNPGNGSDRHRAKPQRQSL